METTYRIEEPGGDTPLLLACGVGFGAAAAVRDSVSQARTKRDIHRKGDLFSFNWLISTHIMSLHLFVLLLKID